MPFDANKLYCSEILAILLQNNDSKCVSVNGFWLPNDANLSSLSFTSPLSRTGRKCTVSFFLFAPTFTLFILFCYFVSFHLYILPILFLFSSSLPFLVPFCVLSIPFNYHFHHCLLFVQFSSPFCSITLWFHVTFHVSICLFSISPSLFLPLPLLKYLFFLSPCLFAVSSTPPY